MTEAEFKAIGFVSDGKGNYRKPTMLERALNQSVPSTLFPPVKKRAGRPKLEIDKITATETMGSLLIIIPGLISGLNGDHGLIRENHWDSKKVKDTYISFIKSCTTKKFKGKVKITYTRFTNQLMDWDNHCSSFKHIGDALVSCGVIKEDKPQIVVEFLPKQILVSKNEKRMEILILDF